MHLGSLESTQEARVALGYRLEQLLRPIYTLRLVLQICRPREIVKQIGPDAGKSVKRSQIFSESADMSD